MEGVDYSRDRARVIRRRRVAAVAVALLVAAAAAFLIATAGGPSPEDALEDFLAAYEERDYEAAAALTDGPAEEVAEALEANVAGLDGAALEAEVVEVSEEEGKARATARYRWQVPGIGEFVYENPRLRLVENDDGWRVRWRESVVHQALDERGERLGTDRAFPERAPILDRDGKPLVTSRPVIEIGLVPAEADDVEAAIAAIAGATEASAKALRRAVEAAPSPENFIPAITVREAEFEPIRRRLEDVAGVEFGRRELPLAPTREFARALLGSVGPITEEQLEELGEPYATGDNVGQSGLQLAHEKRLAGTPDRSVITRDGNGRPIETVYEVPGERGKPLRTTLDAEVQAAAEAALGEREDVSALVALDPATGDVLAAATRPVGDAFNRAFEGQYPPGSTFKVVSTAALLERGLDPNETVDCPPTIVAGGRSFRNFEGGAAGAVPFRTDFAESCNTAFVSLADRLEFGDLREAGRRYGLGERYRIGVPAFSGKVPVSRDATEQAAAMIGQARILASPLAMAGVAAAVIDGRWRAPRILASDPRDHGPPLPAAEVRELRSLMRDVVTGGTGAALAGVPGEPIGKSGTAEYGSGDPPPTHAWFIAARDDVAVAVLVEDKPSGGEHAAPITARFLTELG